MLYLHTVPPFSVLSNAIFGACYSCYAAHGNRLNGGACIGTACD